MLLGASAGCLMLCCLPTFSIVICSSSGTGPGPCLHLQPVKQLTTVLTAAGIPGGNYTAIEAVVYPLLQGANSSLLTNLLVSAGHSSLCLLGPIVTS